MTKYKVKSIRPATEQELTQHEALKVFKALEAEGYMFPTASNAFVQGYVAGKNSVQADTEPPEEKE